jgi:hypothetical protein
MELHGFSEGFSRISPVLLICSEIFEVHGSIGLAFAASHQRSGLSVGQERSNPGVYSEATRLGTYGPLR